MVYSVPPFLPSWDLRVPSGAKQTLTSGERGVIFLESLMNENWDRQMWPVCGLSLRSSFPPNAQNSRKISSQDQPTWPIVEDDRCCSLKHMQGTMLAIPDLNILPAIWVLNFSKKHWNASEHCMVPTLCIWSYGLVLGLEYHCCHWNSSLSWLWSYFSLQVK